MAKSYFNRSNYLKSLKLMYIKIKYEVKNRKAYPVEIRKDIIEYSRYVDT